MSTETDIATATTTQIAEYSKTAAALADLSQRYKGVVFPVDTRDGMALAIKGRAEIRGYRVELEKKRVELKKPALERSRLIDDEAKRITAELVALEEPLDEAIKAEEGRKTREREEREAAEIKRVADIQEAITDMGNRPGTLVGLSSASLEVELARMRSMPTTVQLYDEYMPLAQSTKERAVTALQLMVDGAKAQEQAIADAKAKADAEREELAQLREAQRKRDEADRVAREAREKEESARREALEAKEAAARKKSDEEARVAREAREKADQEARQAREAADAKASAAREEADRTAREAREAEAARQAEVDRQQRAERDRIEADRKAVEAAALELMDGEAMMVRFVERFGKRPEFAIVLKAIKVYQESHVKKAAA